MLAELGRRADAALTRGTDAAHEVTHATVFYLRRIVGAVSGAATRVTHETRDLAWNYRDVAADLRRRGDVTTQARREEPSERNVRPVLRVVGSPPAALVGRVDDQDVDSRLAGDFGWHRTQQSAGD